MNKILVILGPTATGKSGLAVKLAKKYNGEIISADSRQVYRGMDIGTGKITKKEMGGVPHYMLDVVSPKKVYSVSDWQKKTKRIITDIISRGKLPIICGGTGFYIQSIVEDIVLPEVPPNPPLRAKLAEVKLPQLFEMLKELDPERAKGIDAKNPVRLIRAIEIATALGKVPAIQYAQKNPYHFLQIGLKLPDNELKDKIHTRLLKRVRGGMVEEVGKLHDNGLSWKRLEALGLEYRYTSLFLQKKLSKNDFLTKLEAEIWQYAKRQRQWFKRPAQPHESGAGGDKKIKWFRPKDYSLINKEVSRLLKETF